MPPEDKGHAQDGKIDQDPGVDQVPIRKKAGDNRQRNRREIATLLREQNGRLELQRVESRLARRVGDLDGDDVRPRLERRDPDVLGRRRANATFFESHAADRADSIALAINLTPLVRDESLDIAAYVDGMIGRFRDDAVGKLQRRLGR